MNLKNNYYTSTYIFLMVLSFCLIIYPQQDTTFTKPVIEKTINDSISVDVPQLQDSSLTEAPLNEAIKDSIKNDTQVETDSKLIETLLEQTVQDSVSTDIILEQDSSLTDTNLTEAINDSAETDSLLSQESALIEAAADSLRADSLFSQDVHPQDISDQAGFVLDNIGKWGKLRLYGSLRINGAFDLNGLLNTNGFSTYDIPVGEDAINQGRFFMAPYQSRLGLEVTRTGLILNYRIKIETDFLGANNGLRLRHAFVETGNFIIGQTWSTFTDVNSVPQTVDIDGPNSSVQLRTIRIRYADRLLQSKLRYIVSLEAPSPDIVLPDSLSDKVPAQFIPDIAGQLVRGFDNGYVSFSTIIRGITVKDSSGSTEQLLGYGFLLAGVYTLDPDNKFLFQAVYGAAISRFITALNGKGIDLVYNPISETFETTKAFGLLGSYTHNWRPDISSAFSIGMVGVINKDYEPADAFSQSWYYSANVFWNALLGVRLGLEFSQGRRINNDGNWGRATRIGFIFYADF